jgi:diguanylate cyclase (GGDEF)-like protein/PAS domain S-box-containing protein
MLLSGTYDYRLVAISVLLALFASYAALDLAGRVTAARGWARAVWLSGGATAMGLGIWAMHYIGMLAFRLPVPILYHYPTVILSLLAAIVASAVALFIVSQPRMGLEQEIIGSLIMGGGIAGMHYIGMAAMRLPAMMEYLWDRVGISVAVAVLVSLVALILAFGTRDDKKKISTRKMGSAAVMGSAIPLMHYTGMWAVQFHASNLSFSTSRVVQVSFLGTLIIGAACLLVLLAVIGTSMLDRLLEAQKKTLEIAQESEAHYRALGEAIPEIVWTAEPDGMIDYCNSRWYELTGLTERQTMGVGWEQAIHPDDLPVCRQDWQHSLQSGALLETQYRLRDKSQQYRWHLARAIPMRNAASAIVKWLGISTDIEEQKRSQETLEQEIRVRTMELADANTRLQEEMWETDVARKTLDQQNEQMMVQLKDRSQRATLLAKMGELLQSCMTKDEVFAAALGFAPKVFPTRGAIALLNSGRSLAEVIGSWAECYLPAQVFEPSSCWALRTGHPHLVVAGDPTAPCAHAAGMKNTYLCIPILAQGEALGIIHFQATDEMPTLADSELSFKTTFAGQLGLSVANIRLREALRTQSIRDPLTGLYNRRYLQEMLEREIRRAVRSDQALGILMVDIDHFKKFNDTYGHEAGDTVLREAATFLTKNIRAEDIVCRFGGEEFVVILPTASLEASRSRAERLRSKIRELTVLHHGQSVGAITVSIGVAAVPEHGTSSKEVIEAADAALYRAKNAGRDRVMVAEVQAEDAAATSSDATALTAQSATGT